MASSSRAAALGGRLIIRALNGLPQRVSRGMPVVVAGASSVSARLPSSGREWAAPSRTFHASPTHHHSEGEAAAHVGGNTVVVNVEEMDHEALAQAALTPKKVVEMLDNHIVGQADAKRAVAVALRNRWRRHRIPSPMKEEIVPKNILMIGPTGCGKTEIARRLAKLADAPFVKVEATKFTEVGFHGRDVDQIIRDLVDASIVLTRQKMRRRIEAQVAEAVEEKILDILIGESAVENTRESFRDLLRRGLLDARKVDIDVPTHPGKLQIDSPPGQVGIQEVLIRVDKMMGGRQRAAEKRSMTIAECRPLLEEGEVERLLNADTIAREAIKAAESDGIVFIDEIDKIVSASDSRSGADASSEGVQRDLLPIIEGSAVSTKYGNVNTDHILFVCSGAFHSCKPSDMLAELQGRLPIRVELKGLTEGDLYRILTEPEHNMIRQQQALVGAEGIELLFTDAASHEIAAVAAEVNRTVDNIGARRLHTVIERIVEEISFTAPETAAEVHARGDGSKCQIVVDKDDVRDKLTDLLVKQDLAKYVL